MNRVLEKEGSAAIVAYNPALMPLTGSVKATLLLSYLLQTQNRALGDGVWLRQTEQELRRCTGLTSVEQVTARRRLLTLGLIEVELKGLPGTLHYRVRLGALHAALSALSHIGTSTAGKESACAMDWRDETNVGLVSRAGDAELGTVTNVGTVNEESK